MRSTRTRHVTVGTVPIGAEKPFALIAGPCVIEGAEETYGLAEKLQEIACKTGVSLIFKASYDKANRTSRSSYRGPGLHTGLEILAGVRERLNVPVVADVHRHEEIAPAAAVLDIIQVPAFLCRQTDFIMDVARTGKVINIKKGQFLAPHDVEFIVEKVTSTGNHNILLTERGTVFGYNNLVVDMRSFVIMRQLGYPVVFDATHSVQLPGGRGNASGGDREFVAPLARAAAAVGIDALFLEVHEYPEKALCDGPNSLKLSELEELLKQLLAIARVV